MLVCVDMEERTREVGYSGAGGSREISQSCVREQFMYFQRLGRFDCDVVNPNVSYSHRCLHRVK